MARLGQEPPDLRANLPADLRAILVARSEVQPQQHPRLDHLVDHVVRWAFGEPRPEELDPLLLLWKMHRRIRRPLLPTTRTVLEFDFRGRRGRRLWLVLEPREVSVCVKPPGFDPDLILHADLAFFYQVWLGYIDYDGAVRSGRIVIDGPPSLAGRLPRWFMWSPMAHYVRAERARDARAQSA